MAFQKRVTCLESNEDLLLMLHVFMKHVREFDDVKVALLLLGNCQVDVVEHSLVDAADEQELPVENHVGVVLQLGFIHRY